MYTLTIQIRPRLRRYITGGRLATSIGALLGRRLFIEHGHSRLFPNQFCMCLGEPGARKSTAIKLSKKLISLAGYETFAADRSSREAFLLALDGSYDDVADGTPGKYDKVTEKQLWGDLENVGDAREVFIVADEFNEFSGTGNFNFYTTLGNLWDWDNDKAPYTDKIKNGKSVSIFQPTISILGGNTPDNFARAFPAELMGQGFLSRLLLIHGEQTGKKIPFPPVPPEEETDALISLLRAIKHDNHNGRVSITPSATELLSKIYIVWQPIPDQRFKHYSSGRRFTHLLKLCITIMASFFKEEIDEEVVIYANTMLSAAEILMPKAIGEYGKSKNSDVTNKIMDCLNAATQPVTIKQLFGVVVHDIDKMVTLIDIMRSLQLADKVQLVESLKGHGYLPKRVVGRKIEYVDFSLLTEEERMMGSMTSSPLEYKLPEKADFKFSTIWYSVYEFVLKYKQYTGSSSQLDDIPDRERVLRRKLLFEEYSEYRVAERNNDKELIADALGDMIYIIYGTAIRLQYSFGSDFLRNP